MRSQNRGVARRVVAVAVLGAVCIVSQSCSSNDRAQPLNKDVFPAADAGQEASFDPDDWDHDGYTPATGDCNEYDALVNPGAFEYVGNDVDDDCDGTKDNGYADCDEVAEGTGVSAEDAATAMNLCTPQFLLKAEYGFPGVPEQRAVRSEFGPNIAPRLGSTMLVMSSGLTLTPSEPGFVDTAPGTDHAMSTARPFAYASRPDCPNTTSAKIFDLADLQLKLKAPTNAKAFAFDFRFMTAEYPDYYCSPYNDAFAALVESERYERVNVAYGAEGEFVSVNVSFWAICENTEKYEGCSESPSSVDGTGFGSDSGAPHGATRWLTTSVPVEPGEEFTVRLAVWDEGDNILDSTVLIDNFRWDINPAEKESTQEVK